MAKIEPEGYIHFERVRAIDVFFNSRFYSGNLKQVFRVNKESDYEEIEVEHPLPDYVPDEDVDEIKKKKQLRRVVVDKMLKEKHEAEDLKEEQ